MILASLPRATFPEERMAVVLIGTNIHTGHPTEVGLFEDLDAARWHVHRALKQDVVFSLWTPDMNGTIKAASITGLSMPPRVA